MTLRTRIIVAVTAIVVAVLTAIAVVLAAGDAHTPISPAGGRPQPIRPGAEQLAPAGAPFSYDLPAGWVQAVHEGAPDWMTSQCVGDYRQIAAEAGAVKV